MKKKPPIQYLVVTLLGEDKPGILHDLTNNISQIGCNITSSQMAKLGTHASISLLLSGTWAALAKMESSLQAFAKSKHFKILLHRSHSQAANSEQMLTYLVEVLTPDKPDILNVISEFFSEQKINIIEVHSSTLLNQTGAALANITMRIHIPLSLQVAEIREQLMLLCDDINVDAVFEPERL